MKEILEWIVSTWNSYWGTGYYHILFLLAFVYLLFMRNKSREKKWILAYAGGALLVFLCPVSAEIIGRCLGKEVYWRVLWIVPAAAVIALAGTELVRSQKRGIRVAVILLFVAVAAFCGKSIWHSENYEKVHNYQKVPDEVAGICNMIAQDAGGEVVRVASDDHIASYIRVYDPSMFMPYGRSGRGAVSANAKKLYLEIITPDPNYENIAALAREEACNYLVMEVKNDAQREIFAANGYEEVGMINEYGVFRRLEP